MADNNNTLKRPFAHSAPYDIFSSSLSVVDGIPRYTAKRRSRSRSRSSSRTDPPRTDDPRPVPSPNSCPSFMSTLGGGSGSRCAQSEAQGDSSLGTRTIAMGPPSRLAPMKYAIEHSHSHFPSPVHFPREYFSIASESTDSSPTTTSSTFDSPIIVEPSPSSSPESPTSIPPLPTLRTRADMYARPRSSEDSVPSTKEDAPKKARNLKNLSLRLPPPNQSRPAMCTAPIRESPQQVSRRRPPNLTIKTPGLDRSFSTGGLPVVPPTPSARPSLRHFESSPSLQTAFSSPPVTAIPSLTQNRRNSQPTCIRSKFHASQPLQVLGEEEDVPVSRESAQAKEKGYPDGPILIYDSGLYLYAEPNCEEASQFDCVFNVAKEVLNPYKDNARDDKQTTVMSVWKTAMSDSIPQLTPCTASSDATFRTAVEYIPADTDSQPEYIHVPWDHNSEILDDLYTLCEMIDDRISNGKKVLIHCQLGVSRSASLVIAYGLYKNPDLDFNTVYGIVKGRSSWVGPNMSLIYQLTDFRSRMSQGGPTRSPPEEWFRQTSTSNTPFTSPAKPEPIPQLSDLLSPSTHTFAVPRPATSSGQRRGLSPRPLPLREKYPTIHAFQPPTPHTDAMSIYPQQQSNHTNNPPTPSLFSPKAVPYTRTSLNAGDLAIHQRTSIDGPSRPAAFSLPGLTADPRSPQQKREPVIMRNIDEFL